MRLSTFAVAAALFAATPVFAQDAAQQQATAIDVDAFARAAAENSLTEVLLSAMALQKTGDKRVEDYAWTMLDHHARAMGDLAESLSPGAAQLPTEPGAEQTATLERMRGLEDAQFDEAYLAHQLEAHGKAVDLFEAGGRVSDEGVANYARATLPVLRAHLEIAQLKQSQPPQPIEGK